MRVSEIMSMIRIYSLFLILIADLWFELECIFTVAPYYASWKICILNKLFALLLNQFFFIFFFIIWCYYRCCCYCCCWLLVLLLLLLCYDGYHMRLCVSDHCQSHTFAIIYDFFFVVIGFEILLLLLLFFFWFIGFGFCFFFNFFFVLLLNSINKMVILLRNMYVTLHTYICTQTYIRCTYIRGVLGKEQKKKFKN